MIGEPDAGKPPVRFDEGVQETCGIVTRLCPTLRHFPPGENFLALLPQSRVLVFAASCRRRDHRRGRKPAIV